jgi:hypothetical protein
MPVRAAAGGVAAGWVAAGGCSLFEHPTAHTSTNTWDTRAFAFIGTSRSQGMCGRKLYSVGYRTCNARLHLGFEHSESTLKGVDLGFQLEQLSSEGHALLR